MSVERNEVDQVLLGLCHGVGEELDQQIKQRGSLAEVGAGHGRDGRGRAVRSLLQVFVLERTAGEQRRGQQLELYTQRKR